MRSILFATLDCVYCAVVAVITAIILFSISPACSAENRWNFARDVEIVDGDTIKIAGVYFRLVHVDATEMTEEGGAQAAGYLQTLVLLGGDRGVTCKPVAYQYRYHRVVAACWAYGQPMQLGLQMVLMGMARASIEYPNDAYVQAEAQAKQHRRGFWQCAWPTPPNFAVPKGLLCSDALAEK